MDMQELKDALAVKKSDGMQVGDVIRWTSAGGHYAYAAIKTPIGYFTTARGDYGNGYISKCYTRSEFVAMLAREDVDVDSVYVATAWEPLG